MWFASEQVGAARLFRARDRASAALDEFRQWLERDVAVAGPGRYAAGTDFFEGLLTRGHWCETRLGTLAAEAGGALEQALADLRERAATAAPGGWPEVQARLEAAHPAASDYLVTYQRIWDDCRAAAVKADILSWPDYPIRYVPLPAHTRDAAPFLYYLFYRSPAPFDELPDPRLRRDADRRRDVGRRSKRGGCARRTRRDQAESRRASRRDRPSRAELSRVPTARREIGRVAAVDCASRIGMFLGGTMAEGWACYATDLMDEIGFLTPDESLAQQHTRVRLLARAVVDIGLHTGSMAFDDAVALYRDRVGMSPEAARGEACKNSMFPGTAIMYWLGTDGLHRLRRERERREGAAFSLRRFHDRVLSFGSIPVPLLERVW